MNNKIESTRSLRKTKRPNKYGVFIIESLGAEDYFDGDNLSEILKLSHIPCEYEFVDSVEGFKHAITAFKESGYRYLHISCHGRRDSIFINNTKIGSPELCHYLLSSIKDKRVFLASCEGGNKGLAGMLIKECRATSVTGSPTILDFDKSAIFWPVFYHVMYETDKKRMSRAILQDNLKKCVDLINVRINYYGRNASKNKVRRLVFRANERVDNRLINI